MVGGKMAWFSRSFIRKRVISLAATSSLALMSLVMAHGPTAAHRIRQTMPVQYVADWHDSSDEAAFLSENQAAMKKMMADMTVKPTGDVDRDFVAMMVPHHQGAVDMAKAELAYGHNEVLRRLAEEIVVNQEQEISAMRRAVGDKLPAQAGSPAQPAAGSSRSTKSQQMMMGMSPDAMAH
jgi:ribosomal protein L16 Arg81 hydroxylase